MKSVWRSVIFLTFYLPILFASQLLGQAFSTDISPYGLYVMAAVCGLRRTEAVMTTLCLGFWLDALQPDMNLFGLKALSLSALTYVCRYPSWRVVLEAYARTFAVCIQCFLQISYLLCAFAVTRTPVRYLEFYLEPFLYSAVLTAILTPPLLRFQKKFFA